MRLNDFRKIAIDSEDGPTAITPKEYMIWHTKERKWLEEQVEIAKQNVSLPPFFQINYMIFITSLTFIDFCLTFLV